MTLFAELLACLRFFSRLPLPAGGGDEALPPLAASVRMLPVAGAILGCASAAASGLAAAAGLPIPCSALVGLLAGTWLTGGLHEDGLADTADGLGGGRTRERKLAIMRDSRIGTYGVLAIVFSLGLRWSALDGLFERSGLVAGCAGLVGSAALSRALALLPPALLPPARTDGLGHGFGRPTCARLAVCAALATVLALLLPVAADVGLRRGALACGAALGGALFVTRLAARQIGGHTGDIAGAAQQAAETAYLLGLAAFSQPF